MSSLLQTDPDLRLVHRLLRTVVRHFRVEGTPLDSGCAEQLEHKIEVAVASLESDDPEPLRQLASYLSDLAEACRE